MSNKIEVTASKEFDKDLKKLLKKFSSLNDDLKVFEKTALKVFHEQKKEIPGITIVKGIKRTKPGTAYIAKKFACKSLANRGRQSGIRITYICDTENGIKINLREIYFKGNQEIEDKKKLLD